MSEAARNTSLLAQDSCSVKKKVDRKSLIELTAILLRQMIFFAAIKMCFIIDTFQEGLQSLRSYNFIHSNRFYFVTLPFAFNRCLERNMLY